MNPLSFIFPTAEAATPCYKLLAPIGTFTSAGCYTLTQYLNGIFVTVIGIAGILAVVMIVICGIRLMTSASAGGKSEAKSCITNAIFGVLIAIGAWILLNTVNPQLLRNDAQITVAATSTAPSTTYGPPTSGTFSWAAGPACPKIVGQIVSIVDPTQCGAGGPGICCRYLPVAIIPPVASPPPATPPAFIPPLPPPATTGDAVFSTSQAAAKVTEGAGFITIRIRHIGGLAGTVDYSTVGLTANPVSDFTPTSGTLFFPAGSTELTVNIPIINDNIVETQENFKVVLSNPTGGVTLNANNPLYITINDDDVAAIDVTPPVVTFATPVSGAIVSSATILTNFTVTEDTNLTGVDVRVYRASTSAQVFATKVCATNGTLCPTLGGTFTPAVSTGGYVNEYFNIVATACDLAKNCGRATTTIGFTMSCNTSSSTNCKILTSGVGTTNSQMIPTTFVKSNPPLVIGTRLAVNAHLIKLTTPTGGGSVSIGTAAPVWVPPPAIPEICFGKSCNYGCDYPNYACLPDPVAPACLDFNGNQLICANGCDYITLRCFIPEPVVIAGISAFPSDISIKAPCGNGGSYPGSTNMVITFGTTGNATTCGLKPGFNYYLNIFPTDGKLHNFTIQYNWNP